MSDPTLLADHAIVIASANRASVLSETIESIFRQSRRPAQIILALTCREDAVEELWQDSRVDVFVARKGTTAQRNDGIARLSPAIRIVTFLDDDIELQHNYCGAIHDFLEQHPEVGLIDGELLKNGEISRPDAIKLVNEWTPGEQTFAYTHTAYGCNMTARRDLADEIKFDERLRLYSWLEDADFSRRCLLRCKCARYALAAAVHLITPRGRVSGVRFGFAQIMNPFYLMKKGTFKWPEVVWTHWLGTVQKNFIRLLLFDRKIDRWGRLKGNFSALWMIAAGRCEPEYVEKMT